MLKHKSNQANHSPKRKKIKRCIENFANAATELKMNLESN
jgi:hypothetical protein